MSAVSKSQPAAAAGERSEPGQQSPYARDAASPGRVSSAPFAAAGTVATRVDVAPVDASISSAGRGVSPPSDAPRTRPAPDARTAAVERACPTEPDRAWPSVFVVVPVFNRFEKTMRFLRRMQDVDYPRSRYTIVIVDDGSRDGTAEAIELNRPDVVVLRGDGNLWWSGGTNMGVHYALEHGADYVLTINDDGEMEPDFLRRMVEIARRNPKYIVGCRLMSARERDVIWSVGTSCVFRNGELYALNYSGKRWADIADLPDPYPTDTMPGNGVLIPAGAFRDVGLYDAENLPQYHADSDLVLRARAAGYKPVVSLRSVIYNDILTKPLVTNRTDLVFSKKSDRYWRAVWATVTRYAPWGRRRWLFYRQYTPFFLNRGILGRIKKGLGRLLELRTPTTPETNSELKHGFNPTCEGGPTSRDPSGAR